jgi:hypothetical protein
MSFRLIGYSALCTNIFKEQICIKFYENTAFIVQGKTNVPKKTYI